MSSACSSLVPSHARGPYRTIRSIMKLYSFSTDSLRLQVAQTPISRDLAISYADDNKALGPPLALAAHARAGN